MEARSSCPAARGQRGFACSPVLTWAVWWGLVCGFSELVNQRLHDLLVGWPLPLGPDTLWLCLVVACALFLGCGLVFCMLGALIGTSRAMALAGFFYPGLLVANVVLMYRQIHPIAAGLLAVGAAVATARHMARHPEAWQRLIHRTIGPFVIVAAIWTTGIYLWLSWREVFLTSTLRPPGANFPNVVLVIWDTVRAASLSTYGYGRSTSPHLSRMAAEGILFQMAIAPSSWTLPSHAAFFTGLWPDELQTVWGKRLEADVPLLAEVLRDHGYLTAGFSANQLFCTRIHGLDRGFVHFEDFGTWRTEWLLSLAIGRRVVTSPRLQFLLGREHYWGRKSAAEITADFLSWVDRSPYRPFFAFLNLIDAHQPYYAPGKFEEMFGPRSLRNGIRYDAELRHAIVVEPERHSALQCRGEQDAYDGAIAYVDFCLGVLVEGLTARGLLESTIVIVTSDHGEHFGEHGLRDHGNSLYRAVLHVPLVLRLPGRAEAGAKVAVPVSLADLPATVLDLVGLPGKLPGTSWRPLWENLKGQHSSTLDQLPVYAVLRPLIPPLQGNFFLDAVVFDRWWYIRDNSGGEELYDWQSDPQEVNNLARQPEYAEVLAQLRTLLAARKPRRSGATSLAFAADRGPVQPSPNSARLPLQSDRSLKYSVMRGIGRAAYGFGIALGLGLFVQLVHLGLVLAWSRKRCLHGRYFALPLAERRRLKKILQWHRRCLAPTLMVLSRLGEVRLRTATFRYRGVPGPKSSCSPQSFRAASQYRPTSQDVFVVTQLRSGTTWMQQLVYQVLVRGQQELAAAGQTLAAVSPWLESHWTISPAEAPLVGAGPVRRIIKTHLPTQLCPFSPEAQYIYVARHPVDCFASCVDFLRGNLGPFRIRLEEILEWFCSDELMWWTPWPLHVAGWWQLAQKNSNVLFITYEQMAANLSTIAFRVAEFLGVPPLTTEELARVLFHASFAYMRQNQDAFEMAPPHLVREDRSLLPAGRKSRHSDLPSEVVARVLTYCRRVLAAKGISLRQFYPDLDWPSEQGAADGLPEVAGGARPEASSTSVQGL